MRTSYIMNPSRRGAQRAQHIINYIRRHTMNISKHCDYLVSFHTSNGNHNARCSGDELPSTMANKDVYSIEQIKCWEIYTCNPDKPEQGGWQIKWVESTPEKIKHFPLFDCCITGGYPNDGVNEVITFLDVNV